MTALILDDEKQSRNLIRRYLQNQFPHIIADEAATLEEARVFIRDKQYDIIFLDIHLGHGTSFDLLDTMQHISSSIIFITAHSEYAIKAFKYSAVDYLVKPIDPEEFEAAVKKVLQIKTTGTQNIHYLQSQLRDLSGLKEKLVIPTLEGFQLTPITNILYCKANGNYTEIVLEEHKKIISSYTLGHFDELLTTQGFLRIHRSFLINMDKIAGYKRGEGGQVVMTNGDELDISRANKEILLHKLRPR
ncbi:MAG: LytTR family DNA-binding domain-containing protein [Bacteroidota bacterium]|nr:LytTR family DNA-binding domain-containing protein [Bacteroidota bacterium]